MDIVLDAYEARVIGCLIEKEITTPDQYPLSLNALTLACNQKSNREPVMELDEATVQDTLHGLMSKRLIMERTGKGSRVLKYQQRMVGTDFSVLEFSEQEIGVICVLLLRGAQTPGEIRTRTQRLCQFSDVNEVESVLNSLASRQDGPYVVKLPREAGRRESRFAHLLCDEDEVDFQEASTPPVSSGGDQQNSDERIAVLEVEVKELRQALDKLQQEVNSIKGA